MPPSRATSHISLQVVAARTGGIGVVGLAGQNRGRDSKNRAFGIPFGFGCSKSLCVRGSGGVLDPAAGETGWSFVGSAV